MEKIYKKLVEELQAYFKKTGSTKAVLGVSGGVDSSVVLKLAVDALGASNVTALLMPEKGVSNPLNLDHAKKLCEFLNVQYYIIPINKHIINFQLMPWEQNLSSTINVKPRARMTILYNFANACNALVLGASNKSEILLGYGTKYGDLAADLEVIGDLLKTDVINLAKHMGLPNEIVTKTPSAELYKDQSDEQELGFPYVKLDQVLAKYEDGIEALIDKGMHPELVHFVFGKIKQSKHKRGMPEVIHVRT